MSGITNAEGDALALDGSGATEGCEVECCDGDPPPDDGICREFWRLQFPGGESCGVQLPPIDVYLCEDLTRCEGGETIRLGLVIYFLGLCWVVVEKIPCEDLPPGAMIVAVDTVDCSPPDGVCGQDVWLKFRQCSCNPPGDPGPREVWMCVGCWWLMTLDSPAGCRPDIVPFCPTFRVNDNAGIARCWTPAGIIGQPDGDDHVIPCTAPIDGCTCCDCCKDLGVVDDPQECEYVRGVLDDGWREAFCDSFDGLTIDDDIPCRLPCCCDLATLTGSATGRALRVFSSGSRDEYDGTATLQAGGPWSVTVRRRRFNSNGDLFSDTTETQSREHVRCEPWEVIAGTNSFPSVDSYEDSIDPLRDDPTADLIANKGRYSCARASKILHFRLGRTGTEWLIDIAIRLNPGTHRCSDQTCARGVRGRISPGGGASGDLGGCGGLTRRAGVLALMERLAGEMPDRALVALAGAIGEMSVPIGESREETRAGGCSGCSRLAGGERV